MTVTSISQSFSLTSVRLNVSAGLATASAPKPAPTSTAEPDRVTLSSEATAPAEGAGARRPERSEVPVTAANPATRAEKRASALFDALDADEDGAITEREFTEGSKALLRRAGERQRARRGDGDDVRSERSEERAARRLERKLERAFARVDANEDGSIDKAELTSALAQAEARRSGGPPPLSGTPKPTVSFTYVSIAVQRYTALQAPDANGQKQAA